MLIFLAMFIQLSVITDEFPGDIRPETAYVSSLPGYTFIFVCGLLMARL